MARLPAILLIVALAAGCGYFEADEPHLAPRTPLLPPTTEQLSAPPMLTPTSTPPPTAAGDPGNATGADPQPGGTADDGATLVDGEDLDGPVDDDVEGESEADIEAGAELLEIVLIDELNHSPTAFTQGLEIFDGRLYESTGAPGDRNSSIRELDRATGEIMNITTFTEDLFAEGLTLVDGRIYQLTWQDGVALVWDPEDLTELERFDYEGQGWGLCYNGRVLVMSDGSAELHFRDPVTFERAGNPVLVTLNGEELPSLNELECVGAEVWANVWQTDLIVRINVVTGAVEAVADASGIGLPRSEDPDSVLNGIAWDPGTETFLITGKDWPAIYEVRFEAAGTADDDSREPDA